MKRYLIVLFLFLPSFCFAQDKVKQYIQVEFRQETHYIPGSLQDYVESIDKPYTIFINEGRGYYPMKSKGESIQFMQKITAINYLVQQGWTFEPITEQKNHVYYFSKEIVITDQNRIIPLADQNRISPPTEDEFH